MTSMIPNLPDLKASAVALESFILSPSDPAARSSLTSIFKHVVTYSVQCGGRRVAPGLSFLSSLLGSVPPQIGMY